MNVEQFWEHVSKTEGCWLWTGGLDSDGYGKLKFEGRWVRAYRLAYELEIGPIPNGLTLDHLCRVRACVRPSHLEPVTRGTNTHRSPIAHAAINARKTNCPKGHPLDASNTYGWRDGSRACRTCRNEASRRYRERKAGVS